MVNFSHFIFIGELFVHGVLAFDDGSVVLGNNFKSVDFFDSEKPHPREGQVRLPNLYFKHLRVLVIVELLKGILTVDGWRLH